MIPKPLLKEILEDKFYKTCVRSHEGTCKGRVTFEHAWIYAGKQIQEKWAVIPLCEYHHDVLRYQDSGNLIKELNQYYALRRANLAEVRLAYPKKDWIQIWSYLEGKYSKAQGASVRHGPRNS